MKKVVVFDYDGTLTLTKKGTSSWSRTWEKIGQEELDYKLFTMFRNNEITDKEWMEEIVKSYRQFNVNKQLFQELASETTLIEDVVEVFKKMKQNNIKIYILSAGIKNIIDEKLSEVTEYIHQIFGYDFAYDENDVVSHLNYERKLDFKDEGIKEIIETENVSPKDILFIGNGYNDETIYRSGVETLCLNADSADPTNKKIWTYAENSKSLKVILPYLGIDD